MYLPTKGVNNNSESEKNAFEKQTRAQFSNLINKAR